VSRTFLIGGGRDPRGVTASHRPLIEAVADGPVACLVADEGDGIDAARWAGGLRAAGAADVQVVALSAGRPVRAADVAGAAAVYVAGGLTPLYARLLVDDAEPGWLPSDVPYGGFSAGAAVAATAAIVGGWRIGDLAVCADEASEDLDQVEPRPGLARVPFAVDVHATSWGTLTRLVHAVSAGLVPEGWAIDEHTCLSVDDGGQTSVQGHGCAYHVTGAGGRVGVEVVRT
jgi:cyanophycinase